MSEHHSRPTVDQIDDMLHRIDIQPRPALAERMASMPWAAQASQTGEETISETSAHHRWRLAAAAGAAVVLGIGLFAVPSVRTFAQDLLRFFEPAPSDEQSVPITVEIIPPGEESPHSGESWDWELLVDAKTLEEASRRAGFEVLAPGYIPQGFELEGVYAAEGQPRAAVKYSSGARVWAQAYPYYDELVIDQSDRSREMDEASDMAMDQATHILGLGLPLDSCPPWTSPGAGKSFAIGSQQAADGGDIGASAQIIAIEIAGVEAEYVSGWWVPSPDNPCMDENGTFDYARVWDPTYPVQQLRWEVNGITYSVAYYYDGLGTPALTMQDLIALAESMFK